MKRFIYSASHLGFLIDGYRKMMVTELTSAFNAKFGLDKTEISIKSTLKNHHITCGFKSGERNKGNFRLFTAEQHEWIREAYKKMTHQAMVEPFNTRFNDNKTESQLRSFIHNQGIQSGRITRFGKGHVPANKGTKGLSKENVTSFKKGHVPANKVPMWTERITKDGYVEIKVPERNPHTGAPTRFRQKHQYLWEKDHGKVPAGHILLFIDGDKTNCDPENLELITRGELAIMNRQFAGHHISLRPTVRKLVGVVTLSSKLKKEAIKT